MFQLKQIKAIFNLVVILLYQSKFSLNRKQNNTIILFTVCKQEYISIQQTSLGDESFMRCIIGGGGNNALLSKSILSLLSQISLLQNPPTLFSSGEHKIMIILLLPSSAHLCLCLSPPLQTKLTQVPVLIKSIKMSQFILLSYCQT